MSLQLYFVPSKVPRTITRKEWYDCWRWLRITRKKLAEQLEQERMMLSVYGTTMLPEAKRDLMEKMINPPLLLGPYMEPRQ